MSRRWQRERSEVGHADDWLMTYADMITLLLCFFAVLLTASASRKDVAAVQIAAPGVEAVRPSQTTTSIRFAPHRETVVEDAVAEPPAPKVVSATEDAANTKVVPPPERLPPAMRQVDAPSGDRITTIEMNSAMFFDSGSATLSKAGEAVLRDIATKLTSDALGDYQITVEGHTDDMPISTAQFPSNWELSTARAAAVVHFFLNENIPARRLRAAGYADTFPKAPNRDERGNAIPENQSQNRRVVIKLEKIDRFERHAVDAPGRS
jgi:chemotaxis protein MotB